MQVRKFRKSDYELFCSWWSQRSHEVMPSLDMIPPTYWVISIDDKPIASFGYLATNLKKVCYACHLVSDAGAPREDRRISLRALTVFVFAKASSQGYQNMLAFGYQPKLTERFLALGFLPTIQKANAFVKPLENSCR